MTKKLNWAGIDLSAPAVMGVLNVTPDSFSDGGDLPDMKTIAQRAEDFCRAGAKILDVGGESTRPGAVMPSSEEEIRRVVPAIAAMKPIAQKHGVKISVDTRRALVMQIAVQAGADIINDVSALETDAEALKFVAAQKLPVVLCHMQGTPDKMQKKPQYKDVVQEIYDYLAARIAVCEAAGLPREYICIDPGIGFGKTLAHNIALLQNLSEFKKLGAPILIGLSRKGMIGDITGEKNPKDRLGGSLAGALFAAQNGAHIIRAHDVAATVQALQIQQALAG